MVDVAEFQDQIQNLISEHGVNVTLNPITRSFSNISADETLTSGASVTHKVLWDNPFWKKKLEKEGMFTDADALIVTNGSVTINKFDLITYAGSAYEVKMAEVRRWQGSGLFSYAALYSK
jgi:hypothetical protein